MNATKQSNKGNLNIAANKKGNISSQAQQTSQSQSNAQQNALQNKQIQPVKGSQDEKETKNEQVNNPESKISNETQVKKSQQKGALASGQQLAQNSKNQPQYQKSLRSHAQQGVSNSGKSSIQKTPKEKVGQSDKTFKNYESNMTSTSPDRFEDVKQKSSPNMKMVEEFDKEQQKSQQKKGDKSQAQLLKSAELDDSNILKSKDTLVIDTSAKDLLDVQQSAALAQKKLTMVLRDPSKRKSTKKWDSQESEDIALKPQKEVQQKSGNQKDKSQKSSVQKSQISEFPIQKTFLLKKSSSINQKQQENFVNPEKVNLNQIQKLEKTKSVLNQTTKEQKEENDKNMQDQEIVQESDDEEEEDELDEEEEEDVSENDKSQSDEQDEDEDLDSSDNNNSQTSESKPDIDKDIKKRRKLAFMKEQQIANRALRIKMGKSGAQAATRKNIKKGKDACQRKLWDQPEDDAIVQLVEEHGTKRWTYIAQQLTEEFKIGGRTGKQCRERWHNHLDPSIKKSPINSIEEKIIFDAHKVYGNKWADIAKLLDGRSDNCIKNYYYSTLRKHIRRINKSLKQCQVAKRLNLKVKTLSADILFPLVKDGKISYSQVKSIDPKKFEDLEHTMRMIFNHEDGQQVTQRGIIAANQNRLKVEMKLEEMRMNELREQQDITDKKRNKKAKNSDEKEKRKNLKHQSETESMNDDQSMEEEKNNQTQSENEANDKKTKNKQSILGKRKLQKNLQSSSQLQKQKRQKINEQTEKDIEEESKSSSDSDSDMKDQELTQTEDEQILKSNQQDISKKKADNIQNKKQEQKFEEKVGEFNLNTQSKVSSGHKNEYKQKQRIDKNEQDSQKSLNIDNQKKANDSAKSKQKLNNEKKATQKNIVQTTNDNKQNLQNTTEQSLSTLLQKNFNSQILPSNYIAPAVKQNNLEMNQMKSLILKPNFKNDSYQMNNDALKIHSQQQHSHNENAVNNPAKFGPGIGNQYMHLNGQPSLVNMINQGYKGYGSGLSFHPFSLANPNYYKNSLTEQAQFELQMQLGQRQHKSKKIKESSTLAEKDNGDASKQKSSSHQHHSSHRSNKKKKKNKKDKKKSHRERAEKGLFGIDSVGGHFYDYSKQRSSSRYPGSFLNPGHIFPSYMNDYAAYNNFNESNYVSSIYPVPPPGNHGIIGPGMTDMIHLNKNLTSQSKYFHPMSHMFDPNFHKQKSIGQTNMQSNQASFHPSIIPQAAPANTSSGLHPHLQQFFMQGSQLGATSGGSTQDQPSFNHFAHGASGPIHQQFIYPNPYFPGAYYPFDPHHHPSSFGAAGLQQSTHSGLTNPLFIPSYNLGVNNQENLQKLTKNNSTQNAHEQNGLKQNNSIQKNFKNQIFMDNQKERATGFFLNMNSNLKKSDQKSDLNIQKNNGSLCEKENSEIKLDIKKSVKSAKSSPTRQKSIEDETKISKSQQQGKDQNKVDKSKTLSDMKNKRTNENIVEAMSEQALQHYYAPQSYNHQMQQIHAYYQKNGHFPPGMGMHHHYMMGIPPYYPLMMHPGMPLMPHPHAFQGAHILHKQDLDDQAIHSRANQPNNQQKAAKKDQHYQQKTHGNYHHQSQFDMPATPVNVKQQTFTIKDLFFGNGDGQTSQGQGSHTPKQGLIAKCIRQQSNISQSLIKKTSGTKDPSADGQQQKALRNDQQVLDQNQKRSIIDQQQQKGGALQTQNQLNNSLPAQYNNTITFMINNFASGPIGASSSSVGGKQNENNMHESLTNIPKTSSENQLMIPKQSKSFSNTALKFHKIQTGDQSSQKDKLGINDHQEGQQKNDKSPQSLSPKKQISQRIADGIKAFQQINIANQQNQNSISQSFKQKISIGQLKDFQRKQADFFNSRGVTPSGHNGAIPLISTSNFLIGGGLGSQNIHHIFGLSAAPMIQSSSFNMNPDRQLLFNDKNQSQGIFVQNGQKFIQSKILAGTPRLLKGQGIGNFILQKGKILHQSVTPKGNGFSKSKLASAALLNEIQQEKIALQVSVQKQSSQANQQQKQLLQSNRHFNLNSGHTFNGNSGGFGNNSRIGSKLNTKTNAQVVNNNATANKIHTIITPKVSTIDKDPEMHRKILEKILKSGSNNQFYDYNMGMGNRIQPHGGAMTDSKLKQEEEMGGAFTKKININNNQSYGSNQNVNLKKSESAGKDMQQQKQFNEKIIESSNADCGNQRLDLNATGQKSGKLSSNQRDADIQERDSLGLFHINRQAIIHNLALNQEPLSSIYTGAPMNKNISFGIGLFQSNNNQYNKQNDGQENLQGDFSIQNISALQTPLLGQNMQEELDQENGMAQMLISQKNQNNTKAFLLEENEQEDQKQINDNQFSIMPVRIIRSGQNGASSTKKKIDDQEIERDSILDPSDEENNDNLNEKNETMKTSENLETIIDDGKEVYDNVRNEDQEMQDCSNQQNYNNNNEV